MIEYIQIAALIALAVPVIVVVFLALLGFVGGILSPDIRMIIRAEKKKGRKKSGYVKEIRTWNYDPHNDHLKTKYGE